MANHGPTNVFDALSTTLLESPASDCMKTITYEVVPVCVCRGLRPRPWDKEEFQARMVIETLKAAHHDMTEFIGQLFVGKRKAYTGKETKKLHEHAESREVTLAYKHEVIRPKGRWGLFLAAILPKRWQHKVPTESVQEVGRVSRDFNHRTVHMQELHWEETWFVDPFISTRYPDVLERGWNVLRANGIPTREALEAEARYAEEAPAWITLTS